MALGAEHVEATEVSDLLALRGAIRFVGADAFGKELLVLGILGIEALSVEVLTSQALGVATEEDVDASTGHVGGDRHRPELPGLRDDLRLSRVLLRVEHVVGDAVAIESLAEPLAVLHRHRAHEDRLAGAAPLLDVVDDGVDLGLFGLVDEVALIEPLDGPVGVDGDDVEAVGVAELSRLGGGGTGHSRELVVEAEVVLEGDRGEGLVLLFDLHPLLGLDGLVKALAPAPPLEDAAGELVDDLHLAVLHHVVLVAVVELLGPQRGVHLMHEVGADLVVQVLDVERSLHLLDAGLEDGDVALVLLDLVVDVAVHRSGDLGKPLVQACRVGEAAAYDERRPGLVDQDRVDLVDDAEVVAPLHLLALGGSHVVA